MDMTEPAPDGFVAVEQEPAPIIGTGSGDESQPVKRRRGRPPGSGTGKRGPRKRSLESEIGGYLSLLNMAFAFMPEPLQGDALDQAEIEALAKALNDYAQQNATVYKYLSSVLVQGGALGNLVMVAILITGRRLARHGVIPSEMDGRLAVMFEMLT
jgi:hypothetical protein